MTNADVQSVLQTYGTEKPENKEKKVGLKPIYGPKTGGIAEPKPKVEDKEDTTKNSTSEYPDIYGPEVAMIPGQKDVGTDSYFKVNTDLAKVFPTEGAPQPYLTDFSKIQG